MTSDMLTAIALLLREVSWTMEQVSHGDFYTRFPPHLDDVAVACREFIHHYEELQGVEHG